MYHYNLKLAQSAKFADHLLPSNIINHPKTSLQTEIRSQKPLLDKHKVQQKALSINNSVIFHIFAINRAI